MPSPNVAIVTRVTVANEPGPPIKPIGSILPFHPADQHCVQVAGGWRLLVPSPKPQEVVELDAIRLLLRDHHVVAAGGGGVPVSVAGEPLNAVIDKDWVAAQLAVALQAELLVFATDVDYVYADFGAGQASALPELDSIGLQNAACVWIARCGIHRSKACKRARICRSNSKTCLYLCG